jgi:hypothetical protein
VGFVVVSLVVVAFVLGNLEHGVLARATSVGGVAELVLVLADVVHGVRAVVADEGVGTNNEVTIVAVLEFLQKLGVGVGIPGQNRKELGAVSATVGDLLDTVVDARKTAVADIVDKEIVEGDVILGVSGDPEVIEMEASVTVDPPGVVGVGILIGKTDDTFTRAAPTAIEIEPVGDFRVRSDFQMIAEDTVGDSVDGVARVSVAGVPLKDLDSPERSVVGISSRVGPGETVAGGVADAVKVGGEGGLMRLAFMTVGANLVLPDGATGLEEVVLVQRSRQAEGLNVGQVLSGEGNHLSPISTKSSLAKFLGVSPGHGGVSHLDKMLRWGPIHTEEETVGVSHARRLFFVDSQRELQRLASLRVTSGVTLVDFGFPGDLDILGDGAQVPLGSSFGVSAKKNKSKEED